MNLYDFLEFHGATKDGTRIAWESVVWTVSVTMSNRYLICDETADVLPFAVCASLPSAGWRVLP